MKIFLGVGASVPVMAAAGDLSQRLQAQAAAMAPAARISWVPPDRFHLTVLFIGHVPPAQLDAIERALEEPIPEPPFDLLVAGTGVFPPSGRPRVIWAGCKGGAEAFVRLQRETYRRLSPLVPLEPEREATPHLTLARVKDAAGLRARELLAGTSHLAFGTIPVDAVTLFESRPSGGGVQYSARSRTPLRP